MQKLLKILYLDIETTPHTGSFWNTFPKYIPMNQVFTTTEMLCWSAKWEGKHDVMFRRQGDAGFLTDLWNLLDEADAVVHYNGKKFDIKHINREFAVAGFGPPSPTAQVDLLDTVRANFKLPSNKLDYVCRYFQLGSKVAHVGIELWYDCMDGDATAWRLMERYNKRDVRLLPKLYKFLKPWIKNHPNPALHMVDPKKEVCPTCQSTKLEKRGLYYTTKARYQRYHCKGCGTWSRKRKQERTESDNVLVKAT